MNSLISILAFVLGVWLLQRQADLPNFADVWLPLAALFLLHGLRRLDSAGARFARHVCRLLFWGGVGFFWAALVARQHLADQLAPEWEGREVVVTGIVANLPQPTERALRFRFDVERSLTPDARIPSRLLLGWYPPGGDRAPLPELRPGERWRLSLQLKRPHGTANPHGFDFEAWLLEQGLGATGYVKNDPGNRRIAQLVPWPRYLIERLRQQVVVRLDRVLADAAYGGVLKALTVGAQGEIEPHQWEVFQRTGVVHLMSISGMHVTLFSTLVFIVTRWLWRRHSRLPKWLPAQRAAVLAGALAALGYALLAGFGVPAQRTVYMLSVVALALWTGRIARPVNVLALALALVVLLDPWAVLAPGFWLSFGAVALIFLVGTGRLGRPGVLAQSMRVQWAVTLGLLPILLALFQQISLISPLANAFAIPLISFGVVPLALAGVLLPFDFVLHAAHGLMAFCMALLEPLSRVPEAVWQQQAPSGMAVLAAGLGIVWMLLPRGFPARWVGALGLLPLFAAQPAAPASGTLWLTVLDVGQGLAVLARTENHALLYDTGPAFGRESDSGIRTILPFLRGEGVRKLDAVIVSHDDIDHAGGAVSVMEGVPVDELVSSLGAHHPIVTRSARHRPCRAGDRWQWDGVGFEMLHPADGEQSENDNSNSCVLKISTAYGRVLLPGDIEQGAESTLLARSGEALHAEVLAAPHHGGKHSSSEAWVRTVAPEHVVFSVGYRNRFDHPRRDVVERYRAQGSSIYRSDRLGAVTFRFEPGGALTPVAHRQSEPRYWRPR